MGVTRDLVTACRDHRIHSIAAAELPDCPGVSLALSIVDLERLLDLVVPPADWSEDSLAARIIGRPQDLTVGDVPWVFELVPGHADAGFEMRAIVTIPEPDVSAVLARLRAVQDEGTP